ncbi:MAG: hypothetical protein WCK27_30330, partial [Verrucomicrobiota bacterium]
AAAKLLLFSRFERFSLFFGEIDADLHCFGRLAKPGAQRQRHEGGQRSAGVSRQYHRFSA